MEVMKQESIFFDLPPGREKRTAGFRFEDDDSFANQQDCVDAHLLARDGEFEQDAPVVSGWTLIRTLLQCASQGLKIAFPGEGLVGLLACETSIGIGAP